MTRRLLRVLPAVLLLGGAFLLGRFLILSPGHRAALVDGPVTGIVWQVDDATAKPEGEWQRLGADHLLIQWIVVDDIGFARGTGGKAPTQMPDWRRIAKEPWARHVTLGLAGDFDEKKARENVLRLAKTSAAIAGRKPPLEIEGYYFPVEVDPTWKEAAEVMPKALALLPRPLWISVYDNSDTGGAALADWLSTWLPADVGVFFQDGAGVTARSPQEARDYADALAASLGKDRLRIITEAFRPLPNGGFRPATAEELMPQITLMQGYDLYLFDGPHYLDDKLVDALVKDIDAQE